MKKWSLLCLYSGIEIFTTDVHPGMNKVVDVSLLLLHVTLVAPGNWKYCFFHVSLYVSDASLNYHLVIGFFKGWHLVPRAWL